MSLHVVCVRVPPPPPPCDDGGKATDKLLFEPEIWEVQDLRFAASESCLHPRQTKQFNSFPGLSQTFVVVMNEVEYSAASMHRRPGDEALVLPLSSVRRVSREKMAVPGKGVDVDVAWSWETRDKGRSERKQAHAEAQRALEPKPSPQCRRMSKARRKLHATLTRYLVSPGETINVIVADPNPETREPMAALIKDAASANVALGLPPLPLIVFQTANQDDIYGALHHARVDIAIVAEALLDDFQAAMLSDVPKDGEGLTVFIAYHTSRQGPIPGTCELACTLPCSLLPSGFCVNVALPLRSRVLPSDEWHHASLLPSCAHRRSRGAVQVFRSARPADLPSNGRSHPPLSPQVDAADGSLYCGHSAHGRSRRLTDGNGHLAISDSVVNVVLVVALLSVTHVARSAKASPPVLAHASDHAISQRARLPTARAAGSRMPSERPYAHAVLRDLRHLGGARH